MRGVLRKRRGLVGETGFPPRDGAPSLDAGRGGRVSVYEELVALAEREAELIAAGAWAEVVGLESQRRALSERLPASPPVESREALERAERKLRENAGAI